ARGNSVYTELFTQTQHLFFGQTAEREHAVLLNDKAEITVSTFFCQCIHEQQAHTLNALTHIVQLLLPDSAQGIVAQDSSNNRRTVSRWVGVVSANDGFHLAECAINGLIVSSDQRTGPHTLVIQAEVLGIGTRDDQFLMHRGERTKAFSIFFQTTGEALI